MENKSPMEDLEELRGKPEDIIEEAAEDDAAADVFQPVRDFVDRYPVLTGALAYVALSSALALRGMRLHARR